jgi:hypothetical protein
MRPIWLCPCLNLTLAKSSVCVCRSLLFLQGTESLPDTILLGRNSGIFPAHYKAPELVKSASSAQPPAVLHAIDSWAFGCLIYNVVPECQHMRSVGGVYHCF